MGMIVSREPVITRLKMGCAAAPLDCAFHWLSPTVSGYHVGSLSMMRGRK
jgi:hypothetical protein